MLLTGILTQPIPAANGEEAESGLQSNPIPLHLNLKESAKFSPETRSDVEYIASEEKYSSHEQNTPPPFSTRNKGEFKSMGVWEHFNDEDTNLTLCGSYQSRNYSPNIG